MPEQLSHDQVQQLVPLLGSVARLLARSPEVAGKQLDLLLSAARLQGVAGAREELQDWTELLRQVARSPDPLMRDAVQEGLMLRGVPEAAAALAVATVAQAPRGTPHLTPEPGPATPLQVQPARLEWTLPAGRPATGTLEVRGGPGTVQVESDQVRVSPAAFGPERTTIAVEVRALQEGMVWTTLRLVTPEGTREEPLLAQWQALTGSPSTNAAVASGPLPAMATLPPAQAPDQPRPVLAAPAALSALPTPRAAVPRARPGTGAAATRQVPLARWIVLAAIGWATAAFLMASDYGIGLAGWRWFELAAGGVAGAVYGLSTWLVPRPAVSMSGRWILASLVSWGLAEGILVELGFYPESLSYYLMIGFGIALLSGCTQWWVLHRSFAGIRRWIVLSSAAMIIAWGQVFALWPFYFRLAPYWDLLTALALGGLLYGGISAIGVRGLVRKP